MKLTVETVGPCKKRLKVEVDAEAVKAEVEEHLQEASAHAQLPGFRKGRVPRAMLEKRFGPQIQEEARDHLMSESYRKALEQEKLSPLGEPTVDKVEFDLAKGLVYEATLEVRPEFELPPTKDIPLARKAVLVGEADLEAGLAELRRQHVEWTPAPAGTALKRGDLAVCTLALKDGEKPLWERAEVGVVLNDTPLGELPTGPADKLLEGHKAGETRQVVATLPADFSREDLRGKMVTISVTVQDVRHEKLPEVDDAFAKAMGVDTLAALKDQVRAHLLRRKEAAAHHQLEEDLVSYLIEKTAFELPQDALEAQTQDSLRRATVDLLMQGVPEAQVKENLEKLQASSRTFAERRLRTMLILARIAEQSKVFVTESDVEDRIRQAAATHGERPEAVRKRLEKEGGLGSLRASIRESKVIDLLLSRAKLEAKA